jgi:hypothetical protein
VNITQHIKAIGFKLTTKGRRYGVRPRWQLDNVEVNFDKHGVNVWVNHPDGQFGGPARKLYLSFKEWPQSVALSVVETLVNTRKAKHCEEAVTVRVPAAFFDDHESRDCEPYCEPVKRAGRYVWLSLDDPGLEELLDDARHYADPTWTLDPCYFGLKRSAVATVKAIEAAQVKS